MDHEGGTYKALCAGDDGDRPIDAQTGMRYSGTVF